MALRRRQESDTSQYNHERHRQRLPAAVRHQIRGAHRELRIGPGEGAAHEVHNASRPAAGSRDVAAVQLEVQRRAAVASTGPGGQVHT